MPGPEEPPPSWGARRQVTPQVTPERFLSERQHQMGQAQEGTPLALMTSQGGAGGHLAFWVGQVPGLPLTGLTAGPSWETYIREPLGKRTTTPARLHFPSTGDTQVFGPGGW